MIRRWLERRRLRRTCTHPRQEGIYGDAIRDAGWKRARCLDCGALLPDLPATA